MSKIISIIGGKGGTGKTTTTINLGAALNEIGKSSIIIDGNLTTPNIGIYLGIPVVPVNLHHVLQKKNHISEAMYLHPSGMQIIPGDISTEQLKNVDPLKLNKTMLDLEGLADYILIDAAAGLGREAIAAIKACDKVLIVTNPEMPAVTDALKTIQIVQDMKKQVLGIALTRNRGDGWDMSVNDVEEMLEYPVLGVISEDDNVRKAMVLKNPIMFSYPNTNASVDYKKLAAKIAGVRYKEKIEKEESFWDKLRSVFGI